MLRRKRTLGILAVVILVPIIGIAWWLLAPLFTSTTVDEEFPFASTASVPSDMTRDQVEKVMSGIARVDQTANEEMLVPVDPATELASALSTGDSKTMDSVVKTLADAAVKSMPGTMTATAKDEMTQAMAKAMMDALPEAMAKAEAQTTIEPVRLKSGQFRDQDRFHKGSGTATIYRLADGSQLLRLEDFQVTNGPDLRVILTRSQTPEAAGQVTGPGHLELSKLKGNMGNQNYPIPDDADVSTFNSVVIFCKPFKVIFSVASLESAG
jgi:ribosomal protein S11